MPIGILLVDKPSGPTSHDVVQIVRRGTREKKVGHAGTLDPLATGVLVICLGAATRLSEYLIAEDKRYRARQAQENHIGRGNQETHQQDRAAAQAVGQFAAHQGRYERSGAE